MVSFFFAKVKIFRFWPKTMDYITHGLIFVSPKKVLGKVCNLIGNEKKKSNGACFSCIAPSSGEL